ncbi:MAG TPA: cupredoxin domain-containing protein [Solirubrobacterales bacterium]|nr:cupredoxin domain-containing protein [Solirubrobacterales bacterium]
MGRSTRLKVGAALSPLAVIAVLLVGCGDSGDSADRTTSNAANVAAEEKAVKTTTVTIEDFAYKPPRIAIPKETPITVINRDSTRHTLTSLEPGGFDSGSVHGGAKDSAVVYVEPGTYPYYCVFHPSMRGVVVVEK